MVALAIALLGFAQHLPVWSGTGYKCNLAVVAGNRGRHVFVRRAPKGTAPVSDVLAGGARIYVCDESVYWLSRERRAWLGIAYRANGKPCSGAIGDEGLAVGLSSRCRTGWISDRRVTIISG